MKLENKKLNSIIGHLEPYKKEIYITGVVIVFESATSLVLPLIYGRVVDAVTRGILFDHSVYFLLASWAVIAFLGAYFLRIRVRRSNAIAYQASTDVMIGLVRHLINLPLSFHKTQKIGEVIQRFSRADGYMYTLINEGLFYAIPNILTSILASAIIMWVNWKLAMIYVSFVVIYVLVTIKKTNPIITYQKKMNKFYEKVYGDIFDRTPNIVSIKSNTTEDLENKRNVENFSKGFDLNTKQIDLYTNLGVLQTIIYTVSFLSLFFLGIYFVSVRNITIGQFIALLAYINFAIFSIRNLGNQYKTFQEGIVTINRAQKIFSEDPEKYDDPNAVELQDVKGTIEFKNVGFSYDKEMVLENISFKAEAGQMVAIVGKSGEGKSTLVDLISRYNIPQKGKIFLDKNDIQKIRLKNLRDNIAIVPQEIDLFNDTIKNNIGYSKIGATDEEITRAAKLAHCHEFISKFPKAYDQVVGEKGVKLSTGQKQRVAIARAILRDPRILILDEATSALDSESEQYVQEALKEVMKKRTSFVIAHRLSTIKKADLILVIENGRIVEAGDHKELIEKSGVYHKLSELQQISV